MIEVKKKASSTSFTTIQTDSGTSPVATGANDILTITSSNNSIVIEGNSGADTIDIRASALVKLSDRYPRFYSGFWYRGAGTTGTQAKSANVLRGTIICVSENVTIDALGVEVTASATGNLRLGIFELNEANPKTGTIVAQTAEINVSSVTGEITGAVSFTLLKDKLYALCVVQDSSMTFRDISAGQASSIGQATASEGVIAGENFSTNFTYGVLTDTTVSDITFRPPIVYFKKA
jgi:hypothetical protein